MDENYLYQILGTWVINDFQKKSSSKIKSDYMKFGEEHLKFILIQDSFERVRINIKFENFKSKSLRFKAKFELVSKDPLKNLFASNEFDINPYSQQPTIEFQIYGLDFDDLYVVDDKVTIRYDISCISGTASENVNSNEDETDTQVEKKDSWEIADFDKVADNVESENYYIQDLVFKLLINRPHDYVETHAKFAVEIKCVKIENKNTKYTFRIEILNEFQTLSKEKSVTYQFEKEGDSVTLEFDLEFNEITELNGYLAMDGASLKLKFANYNISQEPDELSVFSDYVDKITNNSFDSYSISNYDNNSNTSYGYISYNNNYSTNYTRLDSSKESTGYVGLRNQGATCYMNSMLQSLFHLPAFRRLVYRMHTTGTEDVSKSIPLCLQRLFVNMQCSDKACSTKALTKSFGWDDYQTIVQHDVQEFSRVLLDNLEEKMKNTELDGEIAKLFRGKYRSFIRCVNVPFESSKIEDFYDLQLVVKDTPNLAASFEKYLETESLEGDNQYNTDQYGKQDAKMGTEFVEFPSILHLHLRRFEYDFNYDQMVKVNSRFEFPQTIDLSEYLAKDADRSKSNVFDLYGVLVHSGTTYGGHYYAFLRTSTGPQWYQFNDSHVSAATLQQSIDENFGGSSSATPETTTSYGTSYSYNRYSYSYNTSYEKSYSAYMLVYVRKSDADKIFTPVSDDEIPEHLKKYFKDHPDDDESTSTYSSSSNELTIKVVPEEGIIVNTIRGKIGYECDDLIKSFTFARATDNDGTIYEKVAEGFGLKPEQIRLWISYYQFTPYSILSNKDASLTYSTSFFLQKKAEDDELEYSSKLIILMKFFDLTLPRPLQYIGSTLIEKSEPISSLFPKVMQILGLPENLANDLLVFQEYSDYARSIESTQTFQSEYSKIQSLIFQFEQKFDEAEEKERSDLLKTSSFHFYTDEDIPRFLPKTEESKEGENKEESDDKEKEKKEKEENEIEQYKDLPLLAYYDVCGAQKVKDVNQYYQSLKDPVIALAFDYNNITKPIAKVQFSPSLYLNDLKNFVVKAFKLNYNPETDLLLVYKKSYYENEPYWEPISSETISNEFYTYYNSKTAHRLYYRLIPNMTKEKMDTMATVDVSVSEDGYNVSLKRKLLIDKESSVEKLKDKIFEMLNKDPNDFDQVKYRLSKIYDHKYEKIYTDMTQIIQSYDTNFRLDFIPEEQRGLAFAKATEISKPPGFENFNADSSETDADTDKKDEAENNNDDSRVLIQGSHLTTEYSRAKNCDDPFFFILDKNESYEDFFNRVKETLKVGDSMKRCKLLISTDNPTVSQSTHFMKSDKKVGEYLESLNLTQEPRLYLFHPPHTQSSSRNEAIKINN